MTNRKQQLIDDVGFIFTECARVNEALQAPGGLKNLPKGDWMFELPHPTGKGKMICGRVAAQRLEELARSAIRRSGLSRQVDVLAVRRMLGDILVRKFLKEKRGIDISQVERALAEAGRMAAKSCSTITHFLPCHLMIAQQPASFDIGPVRFHSRASFRSLLAKQLRGERRREVRPNQRIIFDVVRYFKTFGWVAEVAIEQCDDKTSSPLAEQAATAALNCLHLLLGGGHTRRMAVGGPAIDFDKRGGFSLSAGGSLITSAVYGGGPGEVVYEDDWFSMFDHSDYKEGLRLCGIALEAAVDPRLTRPISDRFLDAALWFGEAVREKSPAAKVVKFVTAIERMLMTDEKDDITTLVSERLAALCSRGAESREQLRDEARRLYSLRSKLVHGSLSPNAEAVHEGVKLGAELAQDALLAALVALGELGLRDETATTGQLSAWYDMIITKTDRIIAEQAVGADAAAEALTCNPSDHLRRERSAALGAVADGPDLGSVGIVGQPRARHPAHTQSSLPNIEHNDIVVFMIPDLIELGSLCPWAVLPPGIHDTTLAEVEARFATTPHRKWLFDGFVRMAEALALAGCSYVYLDGSFVTAKPHPGDYDGCWEHDGVDPAKLDPVLLNFENKRAAQKAKYLGEMFIAGMPNGPGGPFLDFFQVEKSSGLAKGILRIPLAPLKGATP